VTANFSQYVPPGVYVQDDSQPIVVTTGVPTSTVTLVGPARGYQNSSDTFSLYSQTSTFLTFRGVFVPGGTNVVGAPLPVVTKTDGTVLTVNADYAFTVDTSDGGGATNNRVSIHRLSADSGNPQNPAVASPNGLADGDQVIITYAYADSSYYTPQEFSDPDLVSQRYGLAITSDATSPDTILSPMTLAAQIAFANGANSVLCCPIDQSSNAVALRDQFKNAYVKLEADFRVTMIVPLFAGVAETTVTTSAPVLESFIADLKAHCVATSADGFGRMAFAGAPKTYEETTDFTLVSTVLDHKRVVLLYPGRVSYYNGVVNRFVDVDGYYLAAAAAGVLAAGSVQRGLTKKSVVGFAGLPASVFQKMSKAYKNSLSRDGVCVFEQNRNNDINCRHGVSTDMTSINTREISMTRIADTLYSAIQVGMDNAGLIGEPIDLEMPSRVKGALSGILEQLKGNAVIVDYQNLAVRQQTSPQGDPTVIECKFQYRPAPPLNYVTVAFSIDLTTGVVDLGNASAPVTP